MPILRYRKQPILYGRFSFSQDLKIGSKGERLEEIVRRRSSTGSRKERGKLHGRPRSVSTLDLALERYSQSSTGHSTKKGRWEREKGPRTRRGFSDFLRKVWVFRIVGGGGGGGGGGVKGKEQRGGEKGTRRFFGGH